MKNSKFKVVLAIGLLCSLVSVFGLIGCSPRASESQSSNDPQQAAISFTWNADADCATCHATEDRSMADSTCLASTHEKQGNTCSTCHTDAKGLEKAHENATPELAKKRATKLRTTTIDEKACFSCHGSYEELAIKTAASSLLTDTQGAVVNPHALPANKDHADTTCASCHIMHSGTPAEESVPEYCASCHHANVYQCHTCHD